MRQRGIWDRVFGPLMSDNGARRSLGPLKGDNGAQRAWRLGRVLCKV